MTPFEYPPIQLTRRHGPLGYRDYLSYRSWLRDEFAFRCVFCLRREQWDLSSRLQVDHFVPVTQSAELSLAYDNLLYACGRCNLAKASQAIVDPGQTLLKSTVTILPDGSLSPDDETAERLIEQLDLNRPEMTAFRLLWSEIIAMANQCRPELYCQLMGFPNDLPNLKKLKPPGGNSRPEGIEQSYFAKRERGELPKIY